MDINQKGNQMKLTLTIPALLLAACTPALPPICDREAVEWNKWGTTLVPAECEPRIARPTIIPVTHDKDRDRRPTPEKPDPKPEPVKPDPKPEPVKPQEPVKPKPPVHSDPKPGNPGNHKPVGNAGENPGKGGHEAGGGDRGMSDNPNKGKNDE